MLRPEYLDINKIITDKNILKLFKTVTDHGGVLRFVGGAVRDVLAGLKGFEIDLATDLSPDELVEACQESGLKTVPIGIKYATTGVVINNKIIEVSSLRKELKNKDFTSEFEFTDDWNADASKRDLTINAVYADEHGNVFDYYNGIDDLENGLIRFIGHTEERIKENPIRIMRFFRFYSIFGKGQPHLKSLKACVENKELLRNVAIEQVRDELFKIFLTPNIVSTLKIIFENDVLSYILPPSDHFQELQTLSEIVSRNELAPDVLRRLFILYLPDEILAENLAVRLHLSKEQKNRLMNWAKFDFDITQTDNAEYLTKMVYLHGADFCKDKFLFGLALHNQPQTDVHDVFKRIDNIIVPEFPLSGADLIAWGIADTSKIKDCLAELKNQWLAENFQLDYEELAHMAKSAILLQNSNA